MTQTRQVAVRLPMDAIAFLDAVVESGAFPTRTAAIAEAVTSMSRAMREQNLVAAYRRGYGEHPQEEWVGKIGLEAFAAAVGVEEQGRDPL